MIAAVGLADCAIECECGNLFYDEDIAGDDMKKNDLNQQLHAIDHVLDRARSKLVKIDDRIIERDNTIAALRVDRDDLAKERKGIIEHIQAMEQVYYKLEAEARTKNQIIIAKAQP